MYTVYSNTGKYHVWSICTQYTVTQESIMCDHQKCVYIIKVAFNPLPKLIACFESASCFWQKCPPPPPPSIKKCERVLVQMGPVRIRHSLHATQSSLSVDLWCKPARLTTFLNWRHFGLRWWISLILVSLGSSWLRLPGDVLRLLTACRAFE